VLSFKYRTNGHALPGITNPKKWVGLQVFQTNIYGSRRPAESFGGGCG
jgi:hypothetical protein